MDFRNYLLVYTLCLLSRICGELLEKPSNQDVRQGDKVTLACSTNLEGPVDWQFAPSRPQDGDDHLKQLYSNGELSPKYGQTYRIDDSEPGKYDLVIPNVEELHAGEYRCIDDEGMDQKSAASATITVIPSSTTELPTPKADDNMGNTTTRSSSDGIIHRSFPSAFLIIVLFAVIYTHIL